ncbi:MAG: hypothetical protein JWP12_2396 [Bacteroidetes bacterium]|nr:hypothetical protein [Bacteroidota bacterium]
MHFSGTTKNLSSLAIVLFVLVCSSCKHEKDPLKKYGPFVETVMRNENGAFRGFNFGEKIDSVTAKETAPAAEADEGYLYYEYKINTTGSFNITYDFDDKGLNEIQSDIFVTDANQTDSVFNAFKSYFDDHFGKEETDMGYNVWSVKSDKFGDVKINLTDQSPNLTTDKAPGKISIWIYPDQD